MSVCQSKAGRLSTALGRQPQIIGLQSCCRSTWRLKSLSEQNAADDDLLQTTADSQQPGKPKPCRTTCYWLKNKSHSIFRVPTQMTWSKFTTYLMTYSISQIQLCSTTDLLFIVGFNESFTMLPFITHFSHLFIKLIVVVQCLLVLATARTLSHHRRHTLSVHS